MKAIDLFAGLGGFSAGARLAGVETIWAANHWPLACEYHEKNLGLKPVCQDLQQADWRQVPAHDLMLASPACQGHSRARGKEQAHHDALRSTAWAVVAASEYHKPRAFVIENVAEFLQWACYPSWVDALQRLGYAIAPHLIDAADHGVPQHRERVFIVGTKSQAPVALRLPRREHRAVNEVIEWDAHKWQPIVKPGRSEATLRRIAAGRARFGSRFVAPFYGSGSGTTGRSVMRPIGTLTTIDRWAVVDGDRMRVLQPSESRSIMSFDSATQLPAVKRQAMHLLGNAVCPWVARDVIASLKERL